MRCDSGVSVSRGLGLEARATHHGRQVLSTELRQPLSGVQDIPTVPDFLTGQCCVRRAQHL